MPRQAVETGGGHRHVAVMKQILSVPALVLALSIGSLSVTAQPLRAQEAAAGQGWIDWGMSFFGDSLAEEVAPALRDMRALAEQFGPAMAPAVENVSCTPKVS